MGKIKFVFECWETRRAHLLYLNRTENMFFYVFHTGMVENNEMVLAKCELEKAHKDNR